MRGWLSDSRCAPGHVSSGKYTGTNPDCSKECVAKGFKTVLVDPEHKTLLVVTTRKWRRRMSAISGDLNLKRKTVRIDTLKILEPGRAMCDVPQEEK